MATNNQLHDCLQRIQNEYLEMPGLCLTMPQARRLWGLDDQTCTAVLEALTRSKFLQQTKAGSYVRTHDSPTRFGPSRIHHN